MAMVPVRSFPQRSTHFARRHGSRCGKLATCCLDALAELAVVLHVSLDPREAMDHRRVISTTERLADLYELHSEKRTR